MKLAAALMVSLSCATAFAQGGPAPVPVRNPFWPIGYEGERAVITAEPRVKIAIPAASGRDDDTLTAEGKKFAAFAQS